MSATKAGALRKGLGQPWRAELFSGSPVEGANRLRNKASGDRRQNQKRSSSRMSSVRVTHSRLEEYTLQAESPTIVPGLTMTSYTLKVPLNYAEPDGRFIDIYFRIVNDIQRAGAEKLPWLLFLQGGPGAEAPRPTESSGWLQKAVQYFHVVLLDQRGTGRSTPITAATIQHMRSPQAQADYIQHFRADNIVRDSEAIRGALLGADQRWSIFGQSFGGFCCLHYLSAAPEGLSEVFMTGGIPPGINLPCAADVAYNSLYRRVITQNTKYYSRFPQDVPIVQRLVLYLSSLPGGGAPLPRGGLLTPRAVQLLGMMGLGSAGGFERLHFLLERTFDGLSLSLNFLIAFEGWMPWGLTPLYAVLHESIYCQKAASAWAAERVREQVYRDAFDAVKCAEAGRPVLFTGEMVFPWMFDEFPELRPFKEAAHILAQKDNWPVLYHHDTLQSNNVPVAAACYFEDMYVDFSLAEETAEYIGGIRKWVTNEYMHSGIREDGPRILDRLMGMTRNSRPLN